MQPTIHLACEEDFLPYYPVMSNARRVSDLRDFSHIDQFVSDVAKASDIRCVTLTEIAHDLQSGRFTIKTRQPR